MNCLSLYSWIIGSKNSFLKPLQENEFLYNQGNKFWAHLESSSLLFLLAFFVFAIFLVYYYQPFNNKPGRHYKLKFWALFGLITFVISFLLTLGTAYFAVPPSDIEGAFALELKLSFANALYSVIAYILFSCIWCKYLPTNAYRFI